MSDQLRLAEVQDLASLRKFVTQTLCSRYELKENAFPMTEQVLRRGDAPCGIHFCLHGPRAVRFSAIWESDQNRLFFYGERGERIKKTQIPHSISLNIASCSQ